MFRFAEPYWLIMLVVPLWIFISYFVRQGKRDPAVTFPSIKAFRVIGTGGGILKRILSLILMVEAVIILVLAMARPQSGQAYSTRTERGIDIMLALDISSSMEALDFEPLTRLSAAKEVVTDFVRHRHSDRIGLVVFAGHSYTLCPLTLDYTMLEDFVDRADENRVEDGTAIGSAIATSINRLRESDASSRIIILLTDGMNNRGNMDPLTAAKIAQTMGIRVYTIGVGTEGRAPIIVQGRQYFTETHIDEDSLREIAERTGGHYYRATNRDELAGIYDTIDELETSEVTYDEWVEYDELYPGFLKAGLALLLLSALLDKTLLRRLP